MGFFIATLLRLLAILRVTLHLLLRVYRARSVHRLATTIVYHTVHMMLRLVLMNVSPFSSYLSSLRYKVKCYDCTHGLYRWNSDFLEPYV